MVVPLLSALAAALTATGISVVFVYYGSARWRNALARLMLRHVQLQSTYRHALAREADLDFTLAEIGVDFRTQSRADGIRAWARACLTQQLAHLLRARYLADRACRVDGFASLDTVYERVLIREDLRVVISKLLVAQRIEQRDIARRVIRDIHTRVAIEAEQANTVHDRQMAYTRALMHVETVWADRVTRPDHDDSATARYDILEERRACTN